ncbi:MAG: hypothetical protein SO188_08410 [Prevotella sp.]|nr:hypothetical protein [Prevotella sp.]
MEPTETRKTFDFSKEKVQTITLAELEATYKENDVYGRPLGGIYHSDLINGISDMARRAGLEVELGDLFAVNNLDGKRPGVALLPEVEEKEGERSIRAHLLRRVFATIKLSAQTTPTAPSQPPRGEELKMLRAQMEAQNPAQGVTNLSPSGEMEGGCGCGCLGCPAIALSYSQHGIQIGIGPNIHICRNQTILCANQLIANYGYCRIDMDKKELAGADWWRPTVRGWMEEVAMGVMQREWAEIIQSLDEQLVYESDMQQIFGGLMQLRIEADTSEKSLRTGEVPPLTQSQINHCMERVLIKHFGRGGAGMCTKWDILNAMTDTLKPLNDSDGIRVPICDTSRLLPQLAKCSEFLI